MRKEYEGIYERMSYLAENRDSTGIDGAIVTGQAGIGMLLCSLPMRLLIEVRVQESPTLDFLYCSSACRRGSPLSTATSSASHIFSAKTEYV